MVATSNLKQEMNASPSTKKTHRQPQPTSLHPLPHPSNKSTYAWSISGKLAIKSLQSKMLPSLRVAPEKARLASVRASTVMLFTDSGRGHWDMAHRRRIGALRLPSRPLSWMRIVLLFHRKSKSLPHNCVYIRYFFLFCVCFI